MVNDTFIKDLSKALKKDSVSSELPPGSPRRYEPAAGVNKHNARIHSESSYADKYKNLPFTFSKPAKNKITRIKFCSKCNSPVEVNKNAVGVICRACNQYTTLLEEPIYDEQ